MRLDKFLKVTQVIKRRTVAEETATEGFIKVNGKMAKPALKIKAGDMIEIDMWNYYKKIIVNTLPEKNSIQKSELGNYITVAEYRTKSEDEN